jgi:hypothetical protein
MLFQGITVYEESAGHWRFVLASGDRCITHPLRFGSQEQALQVAQASFSGTPARVVPFRCEDPAQASDAGRIAGRAAYPDR